MDLRQISGRMHELMKQGEVFYRRMKKFADLENILDSKGGNDGFQLLDRQNNIQGKNRDKSESNSE